MSFRTDSDLSPIDFPQTVTSDLRAIVDDVETLATLLGDLANLSHPMPGSLIAAQRMAETIARNGDGLLVFLRRNGLPLLPAPTSSPRSFAAN